MRWQQHSVRELHRLLSVSMYACQSHTYTLDSTPYVRIIHMLLLEPL
jgi:hypothetical protein